MLVLERKGGEVFFEGRQLKINPQASKGPGKEVVNIEGLEGSNGQKWVSLSTLKEGMNEVKTQGREIASYQRYNLTAEEKAEIKAHQDAIDAIIENAKKRYIPKMDLSKIDISKLNSEQKAQLQSYLEQLLNAKEEA